MERRRLALSCLLHALLRLSSNLPYVDAQAEVDGCLRALSFLALTTEQVKTKPTDAP